MVTFVLTILEWVEMPLVASNITWLATSRSKSGIYRILEQSSSASVDIGKLGIGEHSAGPGRVAPSLKDAGTRCSAPVTFHSSSYILRKGNLTGPSWDRHFHHWPIELFATRRGRKYTRKEFCAEASFCVHLPQHFCGDFWNTITLHGFYIVMRKLPQLI